jgi:hypothetical protein
MSSSFAILCVCDFAMSSPALDAIRLKTKRAEDHLENFKANYLGRSGPMFPPRIPLWPL